MSLFKQGLAMMGVGAGLIVTYAAFFLREYSGFVAFPVFIIAVGTFVVAVGLWRGD